MSAKTSNGFIVMIAPAEKSKVHLARYVPVISEDMKSAVQSVNEMVEKRNSIGVDRTRVIGALSLDQIRQMEKLIVDLALTNIDV